MKFQRHTASFCNVCYKEIPAVVELSPVEVTMRKTCPHHGEQTGMVERDAVFYSMVTGMRNPSIYDGYFLDLTMTCNLRCTYCYAGLVKQDPEGVYTKEAILAEARINRHRGPMILTGGEPTNHPDLAEIISEVNKLSCGVELLSNGVRLADRDYFKEIMPLISFPSQQVGLISNLNLSIHEDATDKWQDVIEHCRRDGTKIESALMVIDSRPSFERALEIAGSIRDVVISFRIKAATNIWDESAVTRKVFVSDMLNWLEDRPAPGNRWRFVSDRNNKCTFVNVIFGNLFLMLVSWYDVTNVDLWDITCPPWYRAHNGGVYNFVTTGLVNEGMARGWVNGRALEEISNHKIQIPIKSQAPNPKVSSYRETLDDLEKVAGMT